MNRQGTLSKSECCGRYAAVRSSLGTFDIINTEHKDWFWRFIGHTAMVYRDFLTGLISVYESTTRNKFNGLSGVQLTPMRLWLAHYPGKVLVRGFYCNKRNKGYFDYPELQKRLLLKEKPTVEQHIQKFRDTPYPDLKDPKQRQFVIDAAIDLPFGIGQNPDRHDIMFCTQLVVDAYQDCGLYTGEEPPSEWQPDDMRPGGEFEKQLAEGVSLGKEIRIK